MGCGTSKAVHTIDDTNTNENSDVIKDNFIQNGNQTNGSANGTTDTASVRRLSRPMTPVPKPVAFDIPLEDNDLSNGQTDNMDSNIPKKLPPKRLLTLAEQPMAGKQLTAEQLSEKMTRAEEKRLELLEERKTKARIYNEKFMNTSNTNNNDINDGNETDVNINGDSAIDKIKNGKVNEMNAINISMESKT